MVFQNAWLVESHNKGLVLPARINGPRTGGGSRTGAVVLEFAFVAVLLVFIVLGMIETSRGVMVKELLSNAGRNGARMGTTAKGANTDVIAAVQTVLTDNGMKASDATITVKVNGTVANASTAKRYDQVSVTVSMPVSKVYWVSALFLSKESSVSETVTMMRQN